MDEALIQFMAGVTPRMSANLRRFDRKTVIIVEDNSDLSQFLAFYLTHAGYETSRAVNSAQGISKALAVV